MRRGGRVSSSESSPGAGTSDRSRLLALVGTPVGVMYVAGRGTVQSMQSTRRIASPLVRGMTRLPVALPRSASSLAASLARRGTVRRPLAATGSKVLDVVVPLLVNQVSPGAHMQAPTIF